MQAIFRSYRYGQTKPVYVYRLVAAGTMEHKVYGRQLNKEGLSARVIEGHAVWSGAVPNAVKIHAYYCFVYAACI